MESFPGYKTEKVLASYKVPVIQQLVKQSGGGAQLSQEHGEDPDNPVQRFDVQGTPVVTIKSVDNILQSGPLLHQDLNQYLKDKNLAAPETYKAWSEADADLYNTFLKGIENSQFG